MKFVIRDRKRTSIPWIASLIILLIIVVGAFPFLHKGTSGTSELPVYTLAGRRMYAHEEIYNLHDLKPFTYPPFSALPFVFSPKLNILPPRPASVILCWYLINVIALLVVLTILHHELAMHLPQHISPWRFWLISLLVGGGFITPVFSNQSHDLLMLLPLAIALPYLRSNRDIVGGGLIGVAAAFKATPLLFLLMFVFQKRWKATVALLAVCILLSLLPDVLFPRSDHQWWIMVWLDKFVLKLHAIAPASTGPWLAGSPLNQSLSGTLYRLCKIASLNGVTTQFITLAAQLIILALLLSTFQSKYTRSLQQVAAVMCGMVLLSPMSSKAHFCVLIVPVAYFAYRWLQERSRLAIGTLSMVFFAGTLSSKDLIGNEVGDQLLVFGVETWMALLMILALAMDRMVVSTGPQKRSVQDVLNDGSGGK